MGANTDPPAEPRQDRWIAVAGATGYVGGRLVPLLLEQGWRVRCLVREPRKLSDRSWRHRAEVDVIAADFRDPDRLSEDLRGCDAAYYLVHAQTAGGGDETRENRSLAEIFSQAAARAGLRRIVYLGALGEASEGLSEPLAARRAVEEALASTGVPLTTLRAAMIIGSGSASFEILRYLVERLPLMLTPRWVETQCQPVAISDVLFWLVHVLDATDQPRCTWDIGGPDVLTYRDLMQMTAEELGLPKRWILPAPAFSPRLSSAWISLITPVTYRVARPLVAALRNRVVMRDNGIQQVVPHAPLGVRQAIGRAISITRQDRVETRWSAAGPVPGDPDWAGGKVFVDERSIEIDASPEQVFRAVCRVGGGHGWYAGDLLWRLRGWLDQLVGGPGLRRGRRSAENVEFGEALDFWRVVGVEYGKSLQLHAEMKVPGIARLEFRMAPVDESPRTRLVMTARFRPRGLLGILYWYAVVPLHAFVFGGMLRGIKRAAESSPAASRHSTPPPAEPAASSAPAAVRSSCGGESE